MISEKKLFLPESFLVTLCLERAQGKEGLERAQGKEGSYLERSQGQAAF